MIANQTGTLNFFISTLAQIISTSDLPVGALEHCDKLSAVAFLWQVMLIESRRMCFAPPTS